MFDEEDAHARENLAPQAQEQEEEEEEEDYENDEFYEVEEEYDQQQPQPNNPQQPGNALPGNGQENPVNQVEDQRQDEESGDEEIPEDIIIEEDEEIELRPLFDEEGCAKIKERNCILAEEQRQDKQSIEADLLKVKYALDQSIDERANSIYKK